MVILETAIVGAAGYGAYKGGDAAIRKTKQVNKEMKRESKRKEQRSELSTKQQLRQQRLAELTSRRNLTHDTGMASTSTSSSTTRPSTRTSTTTFGFLGNKTSSEANTNNEKDKDVNERLSAVLSKLDKKPVQSSNKKKGGLMGMFSSKK